MLRLKYGTDCPDKTVKPPSIIAMSAVAHILGEPLETLNWLHRKYFTKQPTRQQDTTQVTVNNVTEDEMLFLCDSETLRRQASMSLQQRCIMFHRQFPMRRISHKVIRTIYRWFGVTKKKVEVTAVPNRFVERTGEFQQDTVSVDNTTDRILKSGGHLVYVDEAIFKQRDF